MEIDVNEIISQYDKKKQLQLGRDMFELLGYDTTYLTHNPEAAEKVINNLVEKGGLENFLSMLSEEKKAELLKYYKRASHPSQRKINQQITSTIANVAHNYCIAVV